jgi:hypothetical protein
VRIPWFANVLGEWGNITSGADIFRRKCLTETAILGNDTIVTPPPVSPRFIIGYPNPPLAVSAEGLSSTYLLSNTTAVIVIHTFLTANQTTGLGYQSYLRSTISPLKSRGITRIIIDVTGNPGGAIVLGFETFKQFFPQNEPFATTNMRATDTAKLFYEFTDERMRDNSSAGAAVRVALDSSPFDFRFQRDPQGNYYTNVKDAHGPVVSHGNTFTKFQKWDLHGGFTFNWPAFEIVERCMGCHSCTNLHSRSFRITLYLHMVLLVSPCAMHILCSMSFQHPTTSYYSLASIKRWKSFLYASSSSYLISLG